MQAQIHIQISDSLFSRSKTQDNEILAYMGKVACCAAENQIQTNEASTEGATTCTCCVSGVGKSPRPKQQQGYRKIAERRGGSGWRCVSAWRVAREGSTPPDAGVH